jgi:FkbM family methyltransferase
MSAWNRLRYVWSHPANRGRRLRSLARAISWQFAKRLTGRPRDIAVSGTAVRLRCYPDSQAAALALYTGGWSDWHEMGFLRHYLRVGDAFLDVGANVGVYSLLASWLVGDAGRVDAFEPTPETLERLRENLVLSGARNVHVYALAVSDRAGSVQFVTGGDALNRLAAAGDDLRDKQSCAGLQLIEVPCVLLDEHVADHRYAMGKIDIEGAEPLALRGARRMLAAANPPVWLLEMNGRLRQFGYTEEEFAAWLRDAGYRLALYDADRRELTFPDRPWRQRDNVLAVADAALDDVLRRLGATER